jgi:type IV pilus assembly protein PilW
MHASPQAAQGRTLIELLISMVIAFIILGAVLLTSIGSSRTNSVNQQMTRLQEDAAVVSHMLTGQLRMAGYSAALALPEVTVAAQVADVITHQNYSGPPMGGCENGYNNVITGACAGAGAAAPDTAPDSFSVIYEGDASSTIPTAAGLPTDCTGAGVAANTPPSNLNISQTNYSLVENRYFIALDNTTGNLALYCAGSGTGYANAQPIIDNVIDMQVTYGVSNAPQAGSRQTPTDPFFDTVMFMRANQVQNIPIDPNYPVAPWRRISSASVCLLLQSEQGGVDTATPYTNCRGAVVTPPASDLRAYRAVRIQVALKNRTAPCADSGPNANRPDRCSVIPAP